MAELVLCYSEGALLRPVCHQTAVRWSPPLRVSRDRAFPMDETESGCTSAGPSGRIVAQEREESWRGYA